MESIPREIIDHRGVNVTMLIKKKSDNSMQKSIFFCLTCHYNYYNARACTSILNIFAVKYTYIVSICKLEAIIYQQVPT